MKIGTRITGGFVLVMLLTVAVAVAGWAGLKAYSNRVTTSSLAQSTVQNIIRLEFETDMFVRDGVPELALAAVKQNTALLFSSQFEKMVDHASIKYVQSSVARYEMTVNEYAAKQTIT